ncbi:nuclease-related domain-containing DEAD/DEAH box helicase [Microbacterium sp. UBA1612]|uniref:nuclease-related domain-containing DEAD/DEAH box helicase n=1 Tax=Microbacterium sp. UBA1612 TaxID=1946942 RepID=UPI00257F25FA|nr:NERD domain-containing protein [Microbacterium sp. UBA1612]
MPRMIPARARDGANRSEKQVFTAFEGALDRPDWVVIHSLQLAQNLGALMGETDFIVMVPGRGIVLVEVKSPRFVNYREGEWYLDKTPKPTKDPLKQLVVARSSIRGFLRERGLLDAGLPIARLVWFTSIGRHQLDNQSPGDMQFFEWELGWADDLAKPVRLIEKVLDQHLEWYSKATEVDLDPAGFGTEQANAIAQALVTDFGAQRTRDDERRERQAEERRLIDEQEFALELVESNDHVYFDGPAGTGKSLLLAAAARRFAKQGIPTLVLCWNVLMAEQLRLLTGRPDVEVRDLNQLMLSLAGLTENPEGAADDWYRRDLPERALAALAERPDLGAFGAICVDEFQDVAGNVKLLELIFALACSGSPKGTKLVFAGDDRQQILRTSDAAAAGYRIAKTLVPDFVHVQLRRNCRTVPAIITATEKRLRTGLGFTRHRVSESTPGGFTSVMAKPGAETAALATALRELLTEFDPDDIVVLSPFGAKSSLVGELLARSESSPDERWLRKQLEHDGGVGRIRWRSIFKFKGLEADAVVLTDLGPTAEEWVATTSVEWRDLLYVGMTRGKYRCVVVESAESSGEKWSS